MKFDNLFNQDFFPTPSHVLDQMQLNIANEVILEPHAGKGDIIDYCSQFGAKDIIYCEINKDLAQVCKEKARFLKSDFLEVTAEEISHVTQIIMNPPFSEFKKHFLHAWEIAGDGCEITTLCNYESEDVQYSNRINTIIKDYGFKLDLGKVFADAERQTNVSIGLIKLYKPLSSDNMSFEGFYMDIEPEQLNNQSGIVRYDEVQALVNRYISAVKSFDEFEIINNKISELCKPVGMGSGFKYQVSYDVSVITKQDFSKELQKKSWRYVFNLMNVEKFLTSGVMRDINRFVETQTKIPFTVKNVYRMLEIIVGTSEENFNKALVETVDRFTQHTFENRYGVEGWKTNTGHLLNHKFIVEFVCDAPWKWDWEKGDKTMKLGGNWDKINDLTKILCHLTGKNYDDVVNFKFLQRFETNTWYDYEFFEFKVFKKRTGHFKFKDQHVWELLNRKYAKIKGQVLPEKMSLL